MKKITFIIAAAMVALSASAYTVNNPVGADGRYIVKYDCANGQFAAANDMEVDETFVFAVDVTGTWLEEWLKETPTAEGASRGVAFNNWTGYGDTNGDFRRLKQISGNIFGTTCNFKQLMVGEAAPEAVKTDSVTYVYGQLFGFEYTADNPGAGWWMWGSANEGETTQADGADCFFAFAPYTGTKTSEDLYADDYDNGDIFGFQITGYAAPCVDAVTAVEDINANLQVVAVEYYNILGMRLNVAPENGVYVKTNVLENGKRVSEKIIVK
ncbi:MAG: hypothetical protein IJ776_09040 [Paludibacteraceae bacterium]|nr:hypothetical protein [Paludibacteraceae bacterium]